MTTSPDSKKTTQCSCTAWLPSGASLAFLVLRFWLAIRAIVTGIEKFSTVKILEKAVEDSDVGGLVAEVPEKVYGLSYYHGMAPSLEEALRAEPLLPGWALTAYGYALGPLLLITGLALLLGIAPRLTLFVHGLIYVSLTVGMILLGGQNEILGSAMLGIHLIMVALALKWVDHNRWSVCSRCAKL